MNVSKLHGNVRERNLAFGIARSLALQNHKNMAAQTIACAATYQ